MASQFILPSPFSRGTNIDASTVKCRQLTSLATNSDTATISSLTVRNSLIPPSVTPGHVASVTVDPTGASSAYTTLQQGLDALIAIPGDIGVVQLAAGTTLALVDTDFSRAQRHFRRVIVRGLGRTVALTDTVASVNDSTWTGIEDASQKWYWPVMNETLVASALTDHIILNTTNGAYFTARDNTTTTIEALAPAPSSDLSEVGDDVIYGRNYYGAQDRAAFDVEDSLVVFVPTCSLTCTSSISLTQNYGGLVEFEELSMTFGGDFEARTDGAFKFLGCTITINTMNHTGAGGFTCPTHFEACVQSADGSNGIMGLGRENETRTLFRCIFRGNAAPGPGTSVRDTLVPVLVASGCYSASNWEIDVDTIYGRTVLNWNITETIFAPSKGVECRGSPGSVNIVSSTLPRGCEFTTLLAVCISSCVIGGNVDAYQQVRLTIHETTITGELNVYVNSQLYTNGVDITGTLLLEDESSALLASTDIVGSVRVNRNSSLTSTSTLDVDGSGAYAVRIEGQSRAHLAGLRGATFTNGVEIANGSHVVFGATPTLTATNDVIVGNNAAVTFATIATGLAANVNDYGDTNPQMCSCIVQQ